MLCKSNVGFVVGHGGSFLCSSSVVIGHGGVMLYHGGAVLYSMVLFMVVRSYVVVVL